MSLFGAVLFVALLTPQDYNVPFSPRVAAAAGCNDFSETTWDNLTGWTQDSQADFSADATNDELDHDGTGIGWIISDTATTNSDHCALICYNTVPGRGGIVLRANSSADDNNVYVLHMWAGTYYARAYKQESGGLGFSGTIATWGTTPALDADDCLSGCVSGTGASTVLELWHHDEGPPASNCPADWGTPDYSDTDCDALCQDSSSRTYVGVFGGNDGAAALDSVAGGDND